MFRNNILIAVAIIFTTASAQAGSNSTYKKVEHRLQIALMQCELKNDRFNAVTACGKIREGLHLTAELRKAGRRLRQWQRHYVSQEDGRARNLARAHMKLWAIRAVKLEKRLRQELAWVLANYR